DPKLRAKLRWVAARANRCGYSQAYAAADFERAGGDPAELQQIAERLDELPAGERAALQFARQMTVDASAVTDEEVARLVAIYGERSVVAMVLELACANFQDRLILALDLPLEEGGPLPPVALRFPALDKLDEIPRAGRPEELPAAGSVSRANEQPAAEPGENQEWASLDLAALRRLLDVQRDRPGRVSVPAWESVRERLPPEVYPPDRPLRIKWSLVVLGHQPDMGMAWMRCLRAFGREADLDRVLAESVFWVITRTIHCFY
ncbi:MAG TPA: hypothetical protein VML55_00640, partial [Planctomycetaceae bacterium]|nr:hypothetical protein [Planctomycetaceae bacterium]